MTRKQFYQQVLDWVVEVSGQKKKPLFMGVSGAQGIGKTTLTNELVAGLKNLGIRSVCVSIDDFYLTREQQQGLADSTQNELLQQRGYPGTHDIELGIQVLDKLKTGESCKIPRYDKSAYQGLGDRKPQSQWSNVDKPVDIVLLEGWFLGFVPQDQITETNFREINKHLENYGPWLDFLEAFLFLQPRDLNFIVDWRVEAEKNMRASGQGGMSDKQVLQYIKKFIPAYKLYLPSVGHGLKKGCVFKHYLIGKDRLPLLT